MFTTGGPVPALELKVLEDVRNFFPRYNVTLMLLQDTEKTYPHTAERNPSTRS